MKLRYFLIPTLFLAVIFASFAVFWIHFLHTPLKVTQQPALVYIAKGSSIEKVAATLQREGYTRYPMMFILLARATGSDKKIQIGEYQVLPGMKPKQFLDNVAKGKVYLRRYTLVEGWTLKQALTMLHNNPYLKHTINGVDSSSLNNFLQGDQSNFEGYLNPDTYLFGRGVADTVIIKKAYLTMRDNLNRYWQDRAGELPYRNSYDALIVASLIEKETAKPDERQRIAGVIVRRLQVGIPLQIDAAVIYGLGQNYTGKLTHDDLKTDTPYNTYLHGGLPPTPIAMPSLASIFAALHPSSGIELYYVAKGDGSHEFSSTLAEHIAAIKKYHPNWLTAEKPAPSVGVHPLYPKPRWDERIIMQNLLLESEPEQAEKSVDVVPQLKKSGSRDQVAGRRTDKVAGRHVDKVSGRHVDKVAELKNHVVPRLDRGIQKTIKSGSHNQVEGQRKSKGAKHDIAKSKGKVHHH